MKKLEPLEANHTKLKANFTGCEISLWMRNHKVMAAKSAFGCEMVAFSLRNLVAILHALEILLSAFRYLRPTFLDFLLKIFDV